jgi:hypothetical protein
MPFGKAFGFYTCWVQLLDYDLSRVWRSKFRVLYSVIMINERGLWTAVLSQAIDDLKGVGPSTLQLVSRQWFESGNYEPGSYLWICDHLEIDALAIRAQVLASDSVELAKVRGCGDIPYTLGKAS